MSPEFEILNARIDHVSGLLSGAFQMNEILLGFIIDKGLLTPEEAASRLQNHVDQMTEDSRSKPHGLFLMTMRDKAVARIETPPPDDPAGGRPPWFRGVVPGSLE